MGRLLVWLGVNGLVRGLLSWLDGWLGIVWAKRLGDWEVGWVVGWLRGYWIG